MPRKRLTLIGGVTAFVAGLALMSAVPYRFFPMNERDQLIVDLWMPAGTRLAGTDEALRRLADAVRKESGVQSVSAFTGGGAPRFYYNHNPEPPTPNFGELLINTASPEATNALVERLHSRAGQTVPEGWVYVKPLQQGPVFAAPNEVRLVGDNAELLRRTATASRESLSARQAAHTFTPTGAMKSSHSDSTCERRWPRVSACRRRTSLRNSPAPLPALPSRRSGKANAISTSPSDSMPPSVREWTTLARRRSCRRPPARGSRCAKWPTSRRSFARAASFGAMEFGR
jgi:hypothetical protein